MTPLVSMMNEGIITMDPGLTRVAFRLTHPLYWKASIEVTERRNTRSSANYDDHHTDGMSALQGGGRIRLGIVMERRGEISIGYQTFIKSQALVNGFTRDFLYLLRSARRLTC